MTAHLNKAAKDGNGTRSERTKITWADISGVATIGAAVNDCWGLTKKGDLYSFHCLGKRHVEAGTEWLLERDAKDYWWGLKTVTDGLKPLEVLAAKDQILNYLQKVKINLTAIEMANNIEINIEHARRCLCELYGEGKIKRCSAFLPGRGRPSHSYAL